MSRAIKFRVWNTERKRWVCPYTQYPLVWLGNHGQFVVSPLGGLTDENTVFEQWTGLLDKQGKEIYEGDIMCARWQAPAGDMEQWGVIRFGLYEDGEGFPSIGFYQDYTCGATAVEGESGGNLSPRNKRWVVAGNVHENEDLLVKARQS